MVAVSRRRGAVAALACAAPLLAGCHIPGSQDTNQIVVDFVTANSSAAAKVVVQSCGSLPGISVIPYPSDPSVHFNVEHASTSQYVALTECISTLANNKSLQIRGYRIEDGEES